ncbi:adhesion G protein-coupled receptor B2 [Trichonephila clavipes]|nr:adhesion G protein-coupled receptor B2 [Trichonephila clavipes]
MQKLYAVAPPSEEVQERGWHKNFSTKKYMHANCHSDRLNGVGVKRGNLVALHFKYDFWHRTATAGSDVVQSGRPIFDDFFQHLWPYIGNNTANVVFQMVKRMWLIRVDQ